MSDIIVNITIDRSFENLYVNSENRINIGNIIKTYLGRDEKLPENVGIKYAAKQKTKYPGSSLNLVSFLYPNANRVLILIINPNNDALINSRYVVKTTGKYE